VIENLTIEQKLVIGKIYVFRQLDNFTIENRDTAHYTVHILQYTELESHTQDKEQKYKTVKLSINLIQHAIVAYMYMYYI